MILKYPYPYKAWMALANDPDNTLIEDFNELHDFIWKELELPFADGLFIRSFNQNLPRQVSLADHPEIADKHPFDIIHTWGDYMHSSPKAFDRSDAEYGIEVLRKHDISPKVWIDHASFRGNFIHNSSWGSTPYDKDQSGHEYKVQEYTLDLVKGLGIHYLWDGTITSLIGQDRELYSREYFEKSSSTKLKASVKWSLHRIKCKLSSTYRKRTTSNNAQYRRISFPDGNEMYAFVRYGKWKDADIYGLANILSPQKIDELIQFGGTSIIYTHLGKRPHDKLNLNYHIPDQTKESLRYISKKFNSGEIQISPLSKMLDYLVIRDLVTFDHEKNQIVFNSDRLKFDPLQISDLKSLKFSFVNHFKNIQDLKIFIDKNEIQGEIKQETDSIYSVLF